MKFPILILVIIGHGMCIPLHAQNRTKILDVAFDVLKPIAKEEFSLSTNLFITPQFGLYATLHSSRQEWLGNTAVWTETKLTGQELGVFFHPFGPPKIVRFWQPKYDRNKQNYYRLKNRLNGRSERKSSTCSIPIDWPFQSFLSGIYISCGYNRKDYIIRNLSTASPEVALVHQWSLQGGALGLGYSLNLHAMVLGVRHTWRLYRPLDPKAIIPAFVDEQQGAFGLLTTSDLQLMVGISF